MKNIYIIHSLLICTLVLSLATLGPKQAEAGFMGFDSIGDMFDGGGPGASGRGSSVGNNNESSKSGHAKSKGLFGGYTGLKDMFDGGGPGASRKSARSDDGDTGKNNVGKKGFFARIGQMFSGKSTPTQFTDFTGEGEDPDERDTDTTIKGVDLAPSAIQVDVQENITTFFGRIYINGLPDTPIAVRTCTDNGKTYKEGEQLTLLHNPDGSIKGIDDAYFVCRSGEWKIEGSLPQPKPPIICTQEYKPVCGIRQWTCEAPSGAICNRPTQKMLETTYSNKCTMKSAGASYLHDGECIVGNINSANLSIQSTNGKLVTFVSLLGNTTNIRPSHADGQDITIDFGDSSRHEWLKCNGGATGDKCKTPIVIEHKYDTTGAFTARILREGGMCHGACPVEILGSVEVEVSDIASGQSALSIAPPKKLYLKDNEFVSTLLVDYNCDSTIDLKQDIKSTLPTNGQKDIKLSATTRNGPNGDHCFAFEVDTQNTVKETNEQNNTSAWKKFTTYTGPIVIPTPRPVPISSCPLYSQPLCGKGETVISGGIGTDGCQRAPYCSTSASEDIYILDTKPDILFEVKSYTDTDTVDGEVGIRITNKDWSSDNIVLTGNQEIAIRWDATDYDKCLVYIHPLNYNFNSSVTAVTGNTEQAGIDLQELSAIYSVECTNGSITDKREITITAN